MGGGFPIDLVLFGLVAVFLVLRLMSILGKRTGFEQSAERPAPDVQRAPGVRPEAVVIDGTAETVHSPARVMPDPNSPTGQTLAAMAATDRNFAPERFVDGAEAAFRIIVIAFAAGERIRLHPLLSDASYAAFEGAITAREAAGQTQHTEIRAINKTSIEHAELSGTVACITVRFVSDQVNVTLGADNNPVAGTDAVTEITDLWTFERDLAQPEPIWRLTAAHSA